MVKCIICGKQFKKITTKKCCSIDCSKIRLKQKQKEYEQCIKRKTYKNSDKYKKRIKRYVNSKSRIEYLKSYWASPQGRKIRDKYRNTDKYIEANKLYEKSIKRKEYLKNYHQTEAYKSAKKKYNKSIYGKSKNLINNRKRRAGKYNYIESYTENEWKQKKELTKGICPGFETKPHYVGLNNLHRDHIYSVWKANRDFKASGIKRVYTINDIQPLCKSCNSNKKNKIDMI